MDLTYFCNGKQLAGVEDFCAGCFCSISFERYLVDGLERAFRQAQDFVLCKITM